MSLVALVIVVTCMAMGTFHYWHREAERRNDAQARRQFINWVFQGLGGPILVWTFFNSGLVVSPLIPSVAQAHLAGNWAEGFIPATALFLFIAGSWWSAITLAWVTWRARTQVDDRVGTLATAGLWFACALPIAFLIVLASGLDGLGFGVALCTGAVAHSMLQFVPAKTGPTYSKALAKIAFDKFNDAEWEIIKQLEEQGDDYDGWMLLAELYATHFKDLKSAERTVCELCDDPRTTPPQVSVALNRLADWHLNLEGNPENARWALDQIVRRLPDTHMARMAQLRMAQLPTTREELLEQRQGKKIRLQAMPDLKPGEIATARAEARQTEPTGGRTFRVGAPVTPRDPRVAALEEASRLTALLTDNPDDIEARVKFARVLAEALGKTDAAIEQLELVSRVPGVTDEQRQEWLTLQADWHVKIRQDPEQGRRVLERITREFPQSHAAFEAQRRLYVLDLEASARLRRSAGRKTA